MCQFHLLKYYRFRCAVNLFKINQYFLGILIFIYLLSACYSQTDNVISTKSNDHNSHLLRTYHLTFSSEKIQPTIIPFNELVRPKIGLTLSGGGLRGIAQIGVLKILEENNIPIDFIVGTSIGAVIGGLYSAGYSPDELWQSIKSLKLENILIDSPSRSVQFLAEKEKLSRAVLQLRLSGFKFYLPEAYTPGQTLTETLTKLILNAPIHAFDFSRLRVPLKIIATDLLSGKKVVLNRGNLIDAMRASIAIPLLLSPVEYDSLLLVDGGLLDNIPVDETLAFGADLAIAVNCTANLRQRTEITAPWEMADQVTSIMQKENNRSQLKKANIIIDFQDFSSTSIKEEDLLVLYKEGQRRTSAIIPYLRELISLKETRSDSNHPSYFIDQVILPNDLPINLTTIIDTTCSRNISEEEINKSLQSLYNTGYLKNVFAEISTDSSKKIYLQYKIEKLPILKNVNFFGNVSLPDSILIRPFKSILIHPMNHHECQQALQSVIKTYRYHGFSLAEINNITFSDSTGNANIIISEGKISSLHFFGNDRTREYVLAREFPLKRGDIFQMTKANLGIANIYGTGLFNSVTLMTLPVDHDWDIIIRLQEKKYSVLRLGIRYDEERYGRFFLEMANENIFGSANDITLHGQYGTRDQVFFLNFNANRIFKTYITSHIDIHYNSANLYYYENFQNKGEYQRRLNGISLGMGMQIARFGTLSGILRFEKIITKSIAGEIVDPSNLRVQTLGINTVIDTRDQVPFPMNGKFHKFSYEVTTGRLLGLNISYFKVYSQLSTFWTLFHRNTISPKLIWGTADLTTPFPEQYRVGGEESFYGLRDGELVGRNLFLASLEYRYWLPGNRLFDFYLSCRFDFGSVWKSYVKVQGGDFISGKGICLAIKTPIGPISISYGLASRNLRRIYFTAGYNF